LIKQGRYILIHPMDGAEHPQGYCQFQSIDRKNQTVEALLRPSRLRPSLPIGQPGRYAGEHAVKLRLACALRKHLSSRVDWPSQARMLSVGLRSDIPVIRGSFVKQGI